MFSEYVKQQETKLSITVLEYKNFNVGAMTLKFCIEDAM